MVKYKSDDGNYFYIMWVPLTYENISDGFKISCEKKDRMIFDILTNVN
jgi:hypothetical protein